MSPRKIVIPQKFNALLNGEERNLVNRALDDFYEILDDNKLEFFPEFTNHGIQHIQDVLNSCEHLITDESYKYLSSNDIAVLIVAVILHDIGMQISSEGLQKLLNNNFEDYRVKTIDQKSWKNEWIEFYQEAKRFSDEQLTQIFGTSNVDIEEPDFNNLDELSRKLLGEFLRRNHQRLAHEIALGGFPTKTNLSNIKLSDDKIDNEFIDLCGLVARSHGMNLRDTFDYLTNVYDQEWKTPLNINVFFLMVVLRIADYIQIQSDRASSILIKTKKFKSPISIQEWEKHGSIKSINIKHDDPERIYVRAIPQTSKIFIELSSLFKDIQGEFDLSWAILGEVYGRAEEQKNLKIKYRRITSNIDNKQKFSETVDFVPEKIAFNSDPELLKLLIGPLYGEDPKYGVRELLQNAIDAIKERQHLVKGNDYVVKITIDTVEGSDSEYYFAIEDNGIGMTQDTLINYFFKAGASYRKSMSWKKNFIEDNEVKIQKTGRFGVGVLAAFLLGSEFELWTKYYNSDTGYYCKSSLSTTQVELLKQDCQIGTKIRIRLNETVNRLMTTYLKDKRDKLEWFTWYKMVWPKIEYKVTDELKKIFSFEKAVISNIPENPSAGWYKLQSRSHKNVHWSFDKVSAVPSIGQTNIGKLICNGFNIHKGYSINKNYPWAVPALSVFDGNAQLPLSLNRDYLLSELPFEEELIEAICLQIVNSVSNITFHKIGGFFIPNEMKINFTGGSITISDFVIITGNKYTILESSIVSKLSFDKIYQLGVQKNNKTQKNNAFEASFYQLIPTIKDTIGYYQQSFDPYWYKKPNLIEWFSIGNKNARNEESVNIYLSTQKASYLYKGSRLREPYKRSTEKSDLLNGWSRIKREMKNFDTSKPYTSPLDFNSMGASDFFYIKEVCFSRNGLRIFDIFLKLWEKKFGKNNWLLDIKTE
jgi:molecular chaperone HtpG